MHFGLLAATIEHPLPVSYDLLEVALDGAGITGQSIVGVMTTQHCTEPSPLVPYRSVHSSSHLQAQLFELTDHPLALRLSPDYETSVPGLIAEVLKTQKVKRLGTAKPTFGSTLDGKPAEHDEPGLVLVQRQPELGHTLLEGRNHIPCIALALKAHDKVISVANHDHASTRYASAPCMRPEIEGVVQEDVGEDR